MCEKNQNQNNCDNGINYSRFEIDNIDELEDNGESINGGYSNNDISNIGENGGNNDGYNGDVNNINDNLNAVGDIENIDDGAIKVSEINLSNRG